jgi:hypothetical protein
MIIGLIYIDDRGEALLQDSLVLLVLRSTNQLGAALRALQVLKRVAFDAMCNTSG